MKIVRGAWKGMTISWFTIESHITYTSFNQLFSWPTSTANMAAFAKGERYMSTSCLHWKLTSNKSPSIIYQRKCCQSDESKSTTWEKNWFVSVTCYIWYCLSIIPWPLIHINPQAVTTSILQTWVVKRTYYREFPIFFTSGIICRSNRLLFSFVFIRLNLGWFLVLVWDKVSQCWRYVSLVS